MLAMRILFCSCMDNTVHVVLYYPSLMVSAYAKVRSQISDALSQALCNLSLAFLADFTLSDSTALTRFIASFLLQIALCFSFGSKDMIITAFTCLPSYRHSSFTLRAYLCWRHTYCQWPIIELAINGSPKNKMAASRVVQIHMHARFPWSKNRLKFSTFIRRREG